MSDFKLPELPKDEVEIKLPAVKETVEDPFLDDLESLSKALEAGEDVRDPGYETSWGDVTDEEEDDLSEEERILLAFDLDEVLSRGFELGASDVHINADDEVAFTILKDIARQDSFGEVTGKITELLAQRLITHVLWDFFIQQWELDTSYVVRKGPFAGRRTRLNVGRSFGKISMVFRLISDVIPQPEDIGIGKELLDWVESPNGLILVCGPTGSGKSTTLASMIQYLQMEEPKKIVTAELPIEYIYRRGGKSFIVQREVGVDTRSFGNALTSAMRQSPDVILIGEIRNKEEVSGLLRAAESGHLALSTMHTNSCAATLNRIRSLFEGDEQAMILSTLSDNLRGLMNQALVKSIDGTKVTAVREILPADAAVKALVAAGDVHGIRKYQEERGITMEDGLIKAYRDRKCSLEEARSQAINRDYFMLRLEGE